MVQLFFLDSNVDSFFSPAHHAARYNIQVMLQQVQASLEE